MTPPTRSESVTHRLEGATTDADPWTPPVTVPHDARYWAELITEAKQSRVTAAPVNASSEHEQAGHELGLVTALILDAPQAAQGLDLLVNSQSIHPEGAEVFAALLYVSDRHDAAEFWWRFAAGSGSRVSAYCLHLHHMHLGETKDADYWRAWSSHLANAPARPSPRPLQASRPLLPADIRRDILARCHHGLTPHLPAALEKVINQLPVDSDDPDFGEIPRPAAILTDELNAVRQRDLGGDRV